MAANSLWRKKLRFNARYVAGREGQGEGRACGLPAWPTVSPPPCSPPLKGGTAEVAKHVQCSTIRPDLEPGVPMCIGATGAVRMKVFDACKVN